MTAVDYLIASIEKHVARARKRQSHLRDYLAEIEALAKAAKVESETDLVVPLDAALSKCPVYKIPEAVDAAIEAAEPVALDDTAPNLHVHVDLKHLATLTAEQATMYMARLIVKEANRQNAEENSE